MQLQLLSSLALVLVLAHLTHAIPRPQATFITETFSNTRPPPISTATGLTNSQAACVEFGSCSTLTEPGIITRTYAPGISSITDKPPAIAPTDSAESSAYQASLASAGAGSAFSSLSSSREAAESSSSAATAASSTTSSNSTGLALPQVAAGSAGRTVVAFAAVAIAAVLV
ncbi:hypothetical protein V8E36_008052 [Tilletia maclaganii]